MFFPSMIFELDVYACLRMHMLVKINSEEFKALIDIIDWRHVRGNDFVPAALIFK